MTHAEAWAQLRTKLETDRDNTGEMMPMAESVWVASHARDTLELMDVLEKTISQTEGKKT